MDNTTPPTRYQRVQAILDAAAGKSEADYGGLGRFWKLPYTQFLRTELYGVRIIAPAEVAGSERGASSGLVLGLRGQPPFDGSRFPRLPWGGRSVDESDIAFISDWIDDGCPEADHELASFPLQGESAKVSFESIREETVDAPVREVHGLESVGSPNEYKYEHGELKQRMNIDCMTEAQLEKLRFAMREMFNLNKWPQDRRSYNNIALIHQNHCQHGWERFLPWHRVYLYEFEQALQDHCPDVTMPYWDWTMPQYRPEHPDTGWIIPPAHQAYLTEETLNGLLTADPPLPPEAVEALRQGMVAKGCRYTSQSRFFDAVRTLIGEQYTVGAHRHRFIDALLEANALWYPLRYPAEYNGKTINQSIHYHYPTAEDIAQILSLRSFRDFGGGTLYNDAFGFLDQNPHNTMHIWTGGMNPDYGNPTSQGPLKDLNNDRNRGVKVAGRRFHTLSDMYTEPQYGDMFSNLTASYDPIFWPIHVNVDRLWWEWQQMHSSSLPADLDAVLTPWSYTTADTLDISRFGYEYVKSTYLVPVGLGAPVGRFVSKRLEIPEAVRDFRNAEVRLHRVPQLPRSCFIRVFLNMPDANAAVPIDDPHYAGYLAIFGHGPCYGGPGHCELPPNRPRKYDLRPRSHNTPRNHRINVTKAVRKLLEQGARSLQITLVVVGADYREDSELLRLEGLSLNFFD